MDYIYYNLKKIEKDRKIEVTLGYTANIRLMTVDNFYKYRKGSRYQFYGSYTNKLKSIFTIPYDNHWIVVIDLGGYAGILQGSVQIIDEHISNKGIVSDLTKLIDSNDDIIENLDIEIDTIVFCEGSPEGRNANFDSQCYTNIFRKEYPNVQFYSLGSCTEVENNKIYQVVNHFLHNKKIYRVIDRDDRSDKEISECQSNNITVLQLRSIESYLLDDEILLKLCKKHNFKNTTLILEAKKNSVQESIERGHPSNDLKSAAGNIVNVLKKELDIKYGGNKTPEFLRDSMSPLITEETNVYKNLKEIIFGYK